MKLMKTKMQKSGILRDSPWASNKFWQNYIFFDFGLCIYSIFTLDTKHSGKWIL
jgi:hypothetical protein